MRTSHLLAWTLALTIASVDAHAQKPGKRGPEKPVASAVKPAPSVAPSESGVPLDELDLTPNQKKMLETVSRLKWTPGPASVPLAFDATVELPESYQYLDVAQSKALLAAGGHLHNDHVLGIIGPKNDEPWQIYLDYDDPGYVKDDEKLDGDEVLKAMREGQAEVNKERQQQGYSALTLVGWSEPPRYERAAHHLVWGVTVRADDDATDSINYNTRILGRKGFVAVNLVADAARINDFKGRAEEILKATHFNAGARYEDHAGGDKVAEYGLAGLILGGAGLGLAKVAGKVGILALLAKGGKGAFLLLAAPFIALKKFFTGKKGEGATPPPAT